MIIDGLLQFDPALSAITASRVSTNTIDLLAQRDIGAQMSPVMFLYVGINAAFTAAGAATLLIQMQGSTDNATWVTYGESRALAIADLGASSKALIASWASPLSNDPVPRYLRLNYVVTTGPFTGGSLNAQLVLDVQNARQYAAGINITN